jgi:hypothetical protein
VCEVRQHLSGRASGTDRIRKRNNAQLYIATCVAQLPIISLTSSCSRMQVSVYFFCVLHGVHDVKCWVECTNDKSVIGSLRQKLEWRKVNRPRVRLSPWRTTNLTRAAVLPTSNKPSPTPNHINPPPQTWSSTTLSPPSARSALTTYVKLSDNRPFRRDHEEDSGWAHSAAHLTAREEREADGIKYNS